MDPIGFSLENFDAIGSGAAMTKGRRSMSRRILFDGTKVYGAANLQAWLTGYSEQFARVTIEKLLTYALGRGLAHQDMPVVRAIARDTARQGHRFSATRARHRQESAVPDER